MSFLLGSSHGKKAPAKPEDEKRKERLRALSRRFDPLRHLPVYNPLNVTHVLLVAYFRSGSSFLGDLLQQNWKSYYTYEPLHHMTRQMKIDGPANITEAYKVIRNIFDCEFNDLDEYIRWVNDKAYLLRWNKFLWGISRFRSPLYDRSTFHETCIHAKYNIMKAVRLKMKHLPALYERLKDMRLKIIFLVRDPRGIYNSRKTMEWCNTEKVCFDIASICEEMGEDLEYYDRARKVIGDKDLIFLKYEDLARDPMAEAKKLFAQLDIPFSSSVSRFLRTHTKARASKGEEPYSTYRSNSTLTANQWMKKLNATEIQSAQTQCQAILKRLNYPFI